MYLLNVTLCTYKSKVLPHLSPKFHGFLSRPELAGWSALTLVRYRDKATGAPYIMSAASVVSAANNFTGFW